ncbi:MAG: hypothetical protein M1813_009591 [Trichoglossum hirsutum]|nr:MAG: hypothetical protein M1813_009591 [Trichoglossum hirsutum]
MRKALLSLYRRGKTSMAFPGSHQQPHNNLRPPQHQHQHQQRQQQQQSSRVQQQALFSGFTGQSGHYSGSSGDGSPGELQFDIFDWYPHYQSCTRYFLDHAQHSGPVQAAAAFLNISLPFQRHHNPVLASSPGPTSTHAAGPSLSGLGPTPHLGSVPPRTSASSWVSLVPYIRRLVATGFDFPGMLHGWFGDDWAAGVGPLHEQERRNYLFAAKSGGWAAVKHDYDMLPDETVPFLRPLQGPVNGEIEAAESKWSEWLAMEDWMVGPRAPDSMGEEAPGSARGKPTR